MFAQKSGYEVGFYDKPVTNGNIHGKIINSANTILTKEVAKYLHYLLSCCKVRGVKINKVCCNGGHTSVRLKDYKVLLMFVCYSSLM